MQFVEGVQYFTGPPTVVYMNHIGVFFSTDFNKEKYNQSEPMLKVHSKSKSHLSISLFTCKKLFTNWTC